MERSKGIYVLGNDQTLDLFAAWIASVRLVHPKMSICLIPFDNNAVLIVKMAKKWECEIFEQEDALLRCDEWSLHFHSSVSGHYRKLAMWSGPYELFIYIDIDSVVLGSLSFAFALLDYYDVVTGHSNFAPSSAHTWHFGEALPPQLTAEQAAYAAGTGFIVSKRSLIGFQSLDKLVGDSMALKPFMALNSKEQALLNYLFVTATTRFTSLLSLSKLYPANAIPSECWPGDPKWTFGADLSPTYGGTRVPVIVIHWAGLWRPKQPYDRLNILKLWCTNIRKGLPFKNIWLRFFLLSRLGLPCVRAIGWLSRQVVS